MKRIKLQLTTVMAAALLLFNSCNDFLDVVPDNIPTLDFAFRLRSEAEKYLYTCYSYMTPEGDDRSDPAVFGGDEIWLLDNSSSSITALNMARGYQNANSPLFGSIWARMYQGMRVCNIFLENADKVPDLPEWERKEWKGEALFLKAWYHFYLVRMYGPVPVVRENLPVSATPEQVKVSRNTVDECFDYIVETLDEAIAKLPGSITNPVKNTGRITKPIAAALKAKVLVTAASPLFNGNTDQATLKNRDNTPLFNTEFKAEKWNRAMEACREAIEICNKENIALYKYVTNAVLSDTIMQQMTIRNGFCERWNSGVLWANPQTHGAFYNNQRRATANLDPRYPDNPALESASQPPIKIAEMFYTDHGVPIADDKAWKSLNPYDLRKGTNAERYYIKKDYTTIQLHFNREPRFYASLGFDGGLWYGQGRFGNNPDEYFYIACRINGAQQNRGHEWGPVTGYYWKKCVHFQNVQSSMSSYNTEYYPWPILRLADLYLLYAEAVNEAEGPDGAHSGDLFRYIDLVRENAGLKGVKYSWDNYAETKRYTTKEGMRQIIHRERLIELALEGQRFWDLRRWKEVHEAYSTNIEGFKIMESAPELFYKKVTIWNQKFNLKDYFWPVAISNIEQNPNLVQNIGW